jgi:3-carboxy-cis,cis-muconate cycloisomerase
VHWGATSQDVIDTAGMLTLRAAIGALALSSDRTIAGLPGSLCHRQLRVVAHAIAQALPMPFGLKLAEYAAALHTRAFAKTRSEGLALQFGGAASTLGLTATTKGRRRGWRR